MSTDYHSSRKNREQDSELDPAMIDSSSSSCARNARVMPLASSTSSSSCNSSSSPSDAYAFVDDIESGACLHFIDKKLRRSSWEQIAARFNKLAGAREGIQLSKFGECIGMQESKEFAMELLRVLQRRRGKCGVEMITLDELREYWMDLTSCSTRMQIFFDLCDQDSDGRITRAELKNAICLSASANRLSISDEQADEYVALLMEQLDLEKQGEVGITQLESLLTKQTLHREDTPHHPINRALKLRKRWQTLAWGAIQEDWRRLWIIALWFIFMAVLFIWKAMQYSYRSEFEVMGYCLSMAKGAAETLKLNMALVLLPVCRNTLTMLRSTRLASIIPFDDSISFHKCIAAAIALAVLVHGGAHLSCDFPRIAHADEKTFMRALGEDFHGCQPSFLAMVTSIEGVTGIVMVVLMSTSFLLATNFFRKSKFQWAFLQKLTGFNAFWYTHHLFAAVYVLLIVHSTFLFLAHDWREKTTWMYLLIPTLLYIYERFLRVSRACIYKVDIAQAAIFPGDVLSLKIRKPHGFKYNSGMYIFIQCPSISPFEWHPFSITSAPGDEHLSIHVRSLGDWTEEIMKTFSKVISGKAAAPEDQQNSSIYPRLYVDGPYGAAAQDYRHYDVMLLIGLGIGATPFISVLRDMLNRLRTKTKARCPGHAYFYWVTKEQGSFEWFKGVMDEVAEMDHKAVIEMHNYLTCVHDEGDARSALITLVQALHFAKYGDDIVSGTRVRAHFARPDWNKVFSRIAANHPNARVGVFYCGIASASKELEGTAWRFSQKTSTRFDFRKEKF